jgi:hypothetical protein
MHFKTFDYHAAELTPNDRLFDDAIRRDPWVLFHGTSSCCESNIDQTGIQINRPPVTMEELRTIVGIFKSMNWQHAEPVSSMLA